MGKNQGYPEPPTVDLTQVAGAERIDRRTQESDTKHPSSSSQLPVSSPIRPSLFVQAGERADLDAFTLLAKAT